MLRDKTIQFEATASRPKRALVVAYDLGGFSRFFNQPDVQDYVPKFLNRVSDAVGRMIYGGKDYWSDNPSETKPLRNLPAHEKFLGDGAMFIWLESPQVAFTNAFILSLCNRLWNLTNEFDNVIKKAYDEMPVEDIPKQIRFAVTRGTVYELKKIGTRDREYIGFCLNLVSRLQKYCPELSFMASARLGLPPATLEKNGWMRVTAIALKGFPREIVLVDKDEYEALPEERRSELFEAIDVT